MSILTKELIQKILNDDWLLMDDCEGLENCTVIKELARMALAAVDSEPVAWMHNNNNIGIPAITTSQKIGHYWMAEFKGVEPLYRHAQQPVVPEEATPESIEILSSARRRDHAVFQWDEDQRNAAADSWNACRAAMLAAGPQSPGSEPATVPGKWIPVSERMPLTPSADCEYSDIEVNVFDGERAFTAHYATGSQPHPWGYWVDTYAKITHWQPLPSAPQEDKP